MKRVDNLEHILDDVTAGIRRETLDQTIVDEAAARVWRRLAGEAAAPLAAGAAPQIARIHGCPDFQALIPAYLRGELSNARRLLVEDHTLECIPCRRALKEARAANAVKISDVRPSALKRAAAPAANIWRRRIAAAVLVGLGLALLPLAQRFFNSGQASPVVVQAASGPVYRVINDESRTISAGEKLDKGETIRTAKDASAVVALADGSVVEMKERSGISVTENAAGITVHLERGNVIVQAARQRQRHLYVATDDCLVSVTGTIFSVNSGTKGGRISVIEGEVRVDHAGRESVLHPGDQVSTHPSVGTVPVQDEIAWSRDADRYVKLLAEFQALRREVDRQVPHPGDRHSTRLLDLAPDDTVLFVALPNLSVMLAESRRTMQERIAQSATLSEWWAKEGKSRGAFDQIIERVREFGAYLGPEITLSAGMDERGHPAGPLVLAELTDPAGFRSYLEEQVAALNAEAKKGPNIRLVDDPTAAPPAGGKEELLVWVHGDLVAAAPRAQYLKDLAATLKTPGASRFTGSAFHARIADLYREGAGLIIAADLQKIVAHSVSAKPGAAGGDRRAEVFQQLGITNLKHFIAEMKEIDGRPVNRAIVTFDEPRRGMAAWLAAPGPMGALDFISPDANLVSAVVVENPAALVDDLLGALKMVDQNLWQQLKDREAEHGIDARRDLAAPLGGEFAFAVDGPVLPAPSWKMIFEVYDQARLQGTFEHLVDEINRYAATEGKAGLRLERAEAGGRTYYTLKSLDLGIGLDYTYANGYLIAAPSQALVDRALRYRDSGYTLPRSSRFTAALPADGNANFSALFYHNLGPIIEPLAARMKDAGVWARQVAAILRLELRKNFFNRRAFLFYLLAWLPVLLLMILAIFPPEARVGQDFTLLHMVFSAAPGSL
jgi:ferric-dicitrate binding protein FerR (iron transport regulator)